jgi:hypothetical protein
LGFFRCGPVGQLWTPKAATIETVAAMSRDTSEQFTVAKPAVTEDLTAVARVGEDLTAVARVGEDLTAVARVGEDLPAMAAVGEDLPAMAAAVVAVGEDLTAVAAVGGDIVRGVDVAPIVWSMLPVAAIVRSESSKVIVELLTAIAAAPSSRWSSETKRGLAELVVSFATQPLPPFPAPSPPPPPHNAPEDIRSARDDVVSASLKLTKTITGGYASADAVTMWHMLGEVNRTLSDAAVSAGVHIAVCGGLQWVLNKPVMYHRCLVGRTDGVPPLVFAARDMPRAALALLDLPAAYGLDTCVRDVPIWDTALNASIYSDQCEPRLCARLAACLPDAALVMTCGWFNNPLQLALNFSGGATQDDAQTAAAAIAMMRAVQRPGRGFKIWQHAELVDKLRESVRADEQVIGVGAAAATAQQKSYSQQRLCIARPLLDELEHALGFEEKWFADAVCHALRDDVPIAALIAIVTSYARNVIDVL